MIHNLLSVELKYAHWNVIDLYSHFVMLPISLIPVEVVMTCIYHGTEYKMHKQEIPF
jgi:hypothetical protein